MLGMGTGLGVFGIVGQNGGFRAVLAITLGIVAGRLVREGLDRRLDSRLNRLRSAGGSFVVAPGGIELPTGATIARRDLRRLVLRNAARPNRGSYGVMLPEPRRGARKSAPEAPHSRELDPARVAEVSYQLCAEHGARCTTLAGGMTETTATELMQDARRILNLV
jgi:hypothetical protein